MSTIVAHDLTHFAQLKNCPVCRISVSPAEAACARCGMLVHKPSHTSFPAAVKWFAIWEFARANRWHHWVTDEDFWRGLVCDVVNGTRTGSTPNPFGLSTSTPIEQCLPVVSRIALPWREAGAPFTQQQFVPPPTA